MLVIKYQSRIARLVSVYIKDFDAARDVVQESFIRAYKALNNYRRESRFYTWLYRIAVNTSYNYLKSNKSRLTRMESIEGNLQAEQAESLFKNPEQSYQNDDLRRGIQRAVSLLPLELRSALVLREVEGMSYEQIAEVVGCELGTVKSRISRARERVVQKTKHLYESTQK
jgi:RNA polymerase sigma-70 factor (ECF subfamily)